METITIPTPFELTIEITDEQFSVVNDTTEMGNFISVFGDISYEVPQVVHEQSNSPETPVEQTTQE